MSHHHTWTRVALLPMGLPDRDGWTRVLIVRRYDCCGYAVVLHGEEHPERHTSRVTSWDTWLATGFYEAHRPGQRIKWQEGG